MFSSDYETLRSALERRRFTVHAAANAGEAVEIGLSLIGNGSAGFGGSVTVKELGFYEALAERGNAVFSHAHCAKEEKDEIRRRAQTADWFIASTNALTRDGKLVNIDGTGNRVTGMIMGPERVMLFVGKNKLVSSVDEGIERTKRVTCPENARRLGLNTLPCGQTGRCADCSSPERMCNVNVITERVPRLIKEFHLVLIDEELGW